MSQASTVDSFTSALNSYRSNHLRLRNAGTLTVASSSVSATSDPLTAKKLMKKEKLAKLRKEGGIFTVLTPFGALNPFGLYYGIVSVCK